MQRFYSFLNKQQDVKFKGMALNENETIEKDNLVVCLKLKHLSFTKFNNYLDFAKYMIKNTMKENRCFYELIPGNTSQKPYFDIEFYVSKRLKEAQVIDNELTLPEKEADEAIKTLVELIQEEIPELSTNRSHIFVFTSHKDNKRSYHIVIEGFCFSDNKSNKLFSQKIVKKLPEQWRGIVDASMYKSSQQFRIVGSCKYGTERFKTLNSDLTVNGYGKKGWIPKIEPESDEHMMLLLIEASLITQTSGSILLPSLLDDKEQNSEFIKSGEGKEYAEFFEPLTSENIKEALTLCYKIAGLEYGDRRFPYSFMRVIEDNGESSIILLKRHFASMCRTCNRVHEHENPFLLIIGEERDVYLDCRRNIQGKKLFVGKLGPTAKKMMSMLNEGISAEVSVDVSIETSAEKSVEGFLEKSAPSLPAISGVPSFTTKPVHIPDIMNALNSISALVAPKIKPKEKKFVKQDIPLKFKF
jgi:hypothetical protein